MFCFIFWVLVVLKKRAKQEQEPKTRRARHGTQGPRGKVLSVDGREQHFLWRRRTTPPWPAATSTPSSSKPSTKLYKPSTQLTTPPWPAASYSLPPSSPSIPSSSPSTSLTASYQMPSKKHALFTQPRHGQLYPSTQLVVVSSTPSSVYGTADCLWRPFTQSTHLDFP